MGKRNPVLALAVGVGLAVALASGAAAAGGGEPAAAVQLALGDSVAAGVGATPGAGYVDVLHRALERPCGRGAALGCRLDLVNLAVPGATTTTLVAGQLPAAVELLSTRRATRTPVDDVRLVTVDIGGNDVFGPVIAACGADPAAAACATTIATQLGLVAANYDRILSALRTAAGPDTPIAMMAYYNPLPACRLAALTPLADLVLEGGPGLATGLNDVIRAAAGRYGAVVAETAPLIGADDLVGGADCLHPDDSGHADVATAFLTALGR